MKITNQQIDQLYTFTRLHFVVFYDVQSELVDHLANDIEQIWVAQPHLSFNDARDMSFKKFGIFGFMDVIEQKQKAMNKKYWKILWRFTKEWFTVPKIVITASLFLFFFTILQITYSEYVLLGGLFILVIVDLIVISINNKKNKRKAIKKEKVFLLEAMIGTTRHSYTGLVFIQLFNFTNITNVDLSSLALYWVALISAIATLLCLLFYVVNYIIPQKAEELLMETYPEYKMVN